MTNGTVVSESTISRSALRAIAECEGPCVTIVLAPARSTEPPKRAARRLKPALETARRDLEAQGYSASFAHDLLAPLEGLAVEETMRKGMVILRSPELFQWFAHEESLPESVTVSGLFYLKPLLTLLRETQGFYVLELGKRGIHLLHTTSSSFTEVPLPAGVPKSLEGPEDSLDRDLENRSAAGRREARHADLVELFRKITRGVLEVLRDSTEPLILAGTDYELSVYRSVDIYPYTLKAGIPGNPDRLTAAEIKSRGRTILAEYHAGRESQILARYEDLAGRRGATTELPQILTAAGEGRIGQMLVAADIPPDLALNRAIVETIRHAGDVVLLSTAGTPDGARMAAWLRY